MCGPYWTGHIFYLQSHVAFEQATYNENALGQNAQGCSFKKDSIV